MSSASTDPTPMATEEEHKQQQDNGSSNDISNDQQKETADDESHKDDSAAAASSSASPAPNSTAGSASAKKGKGKGKKDDDLQEVDPNYPGQRFAVGETIYANYADGKQWFESKVLKVEKRDGRLYYYLHYQGWGPKYRDWRPYHSDNELHKFDEEGKKLKQEADQRLKEAKSKKGGEKAVATPAAGEGEKKKSTKRKAEDDDTLEDEVSVGGASGEVKLKIPGYLKRQLISDWESVTRQHKLVTLPRPITVAALLREFEQSKQRQESTHQMCKEVCSGIQQYFEKALGTVLLYRFERPQYKEYKEKAEAEGKPLSEIYGAEHLLRLFVKLPSLLAFTKLEQKEAVVLGSKLNDFIKWLDKKAQGGDLFQAEYEATDKDYQHSAQAAETN